MNRRSAIKHTRREIAELLESDDEYPDSFDEIPEIPAYLDDNRFTNLHNVKLDRTHPDLETNSKPISESNNSSIEPLQKYQSSRQKTPKVFQEQKVRTLNNKTILISKGVLSKRDLFLVKSIEEYATDTTLAWFIDFLNYKAVNSHPRSCLVADIINDNGSFGGAIDTLSDFKMRYYLKLVVN